MSNIKKEILGKISDIEYQPNDYDKDRFLLYMDDGNMVYLTLTKFDMINYYDDVLAQLENKKGILYLDNGNHFQIKSSLWIEHGKVFVNICFCFSFAFLF